MEPTPGNAPEVSASTPAPSSAQRAQHDGAPGSPGSDEADLLDRLQKYIEEQGVVVSECMMEPNPAARHGQPWKSSMQQLACSVCQKSAWWLERA